MTNISELTNDCLSQISSLTSPKDVVGLLAALEQLVTTSKSDALWEKFLPSDRDDIVSRASSWIPRSELASKKKLFFYLSRCPILVDKSTVSFALDETSGKVSYMLGWKALSVTSDYEGADLSIIVRKWKSVPKSRFPVCAVLKGDYRLDVQGKIRTTSLSRGTFYGVYFVSNINDDSSSRGCSSKPVTVSVSVSREDGLQINDHVVQTKSVYLEALISDERGRLTGGQSVFRGDGWKEIEMGRYQVSVNGERADLEMSVKEIETLNWKNGIVVCGIEIRPLS